MDLNLVAFLQRLMPSDVYKIIICVVFANALLHFLKERITKHVDKNAKVNSLISENLRELLTDTHNLISRLSEILIYKGSYLISDIEEFIANGTSKARWLAIKNDPSSASRLETTALRFLVFIVRIQAMNSKTSKITGNSTLEKIYYYTKRKIPTALKGNIYGYTILDSETLSFYGDLFMANDDKIQKHILDIISSSDESGFKAVENIMKRLAISPVAINNIHAGIGDWANSEKGENAVFAYAHSLVILMDFVMQFENNPQWEENRFMLVRWIKEWNKTSHSTVYLYENNDVGEKYLKSYPKASLNTLMKHMPYDIGKKLYLSQRGRAHKESHPIKIVRNDSLILKGVHKNQFSWTLDPSLLLTMINTHFSVTRKRIN